MTLVAHVILLFCKVSIYVQTSRAADKVFQRSLRGPVIVSFGLGASPHPAALWLEDNTSFTTSAEMGRQRLGVPTF